MTENLLYVKAEFKGEEEETRKEGEFSPVFSTSSSRKDELSR